MAATTARCAAPNKWPKILTRKIRGESRVHKNEKPPAKRHSYCCWRERRISTLMKEMSRRTSFILIGITWALGSGVVIFRLLH